MNDRQKRISKRIFDLEKVKRAPKKLTFTPEMLEARTSRMTRLIRDTRSLDNRRKNDG